MCFLTKPTNLVEYSVWGDRTKEVAAHVQIGTRVLGRAETEAGPGGEGTLLAIVPIPGTDTSLAIVGYPVPALAPTASSALAVTIPGFPGLPGQSGPDHPGSPQQAGGVPLATASPGPALAGTPLANTALDDPAPAAPALASALPPGLRLDHEQRRVWVDGAEIPLTFQEFELLAFLRAHPATVFSRADLVREVWQRDFAADSRTVDVHVSRLRHKLGPAYGRCLVTEYRVGYQFRPAS
jgi:Transcriptional regulatory protein, C terminal